MGIEFELKFRATEDTLETIRRQTPGAERIYRMQTTYYDTPEDALSARHYTLRCRMENGSAVCTLKTPAQEGGRKEYELECPSIEEAIPTLCKLSGLPELPGLLAGGVIPVCGAKFTRVAKTLELPGAVVELALDSGVLTGGGRELALCEVEVELKSGSRQAAIVYATQLAVAYGLKTEKHSKFRRAQALAKGEYHG